MSKITEKIEKFLTEALKITFKNTKAQKDAFALLMPMKELKGLLSQSKDGMTIDFKNEFAMKKAMDMLKSKKLDKDIK